MDLRKRACGSLAAVIALVALTPACTPASPAPPVTTPRPTASPTETDLERRAEQDKAAAMAAYLAVFREVNRLALRGGATQPTRPIADNATGFYLRLTLEDLATLKSKGWRIDRLPETRVAAVGGWNPKQISLTACEDTSQVRLLNREGREVQKNRPRRYVQRLSARKVAAKWKIADVKTRTVSTFADERGCKA